MYQQQQQRQAERRLKRQIEADEKLGREIEADEKLKIEIYEKEKQANEDELLKIKEYEKIPRQKKSSQNTAFYSWDKRVTFKKNALATTISKPLQATELKEA